MNIRGVHNPCGGGYIQYFCINRIDARYPALMEIPDTGRTDTRETK